MEERCFFSRRVTLSAVTFTGMGHPPEQRGLSLLISPALHLPLKHKRVSRQRGSPVKRRTPERVIGARGRLLLLLLEPERRPRSTEKANSRINCNRT